MKFPTCIISNDRSDINYKGLYDLNMYRNEKYFFGRTKIIQKKFCRNRNFSNFPNKQFARVYAYLSTNLNHLPNEGEIL